MKIIKNTGYVISDVKKTQTKYVKPINNLYLNLNKSIIEINIRSMCINIKKILNDDLNEKSSLRLNKSKEISSVLELFFDSNKTNYNKAISTSILDNYFRTVYKIHSNEQSIKTLKLLPDDTIDEYLSMYETIKNEFSMKFMNDISNIESLGNRLLLHFNDIIYQAGLDAQRTAYMSENITEYQYIATMDTKTCNICAALNGKVISMLDQKNGSNYPIMHNNCRCQTDITSGYALSEQNFLTNINLLKYIAESVSRQFYTYYTVYFQSYQSIDIDGEIYKVDMDTMQGIVILPNGEFLLNDTITEIDQELLELMKQRDNAHIQSEKDEYIEEALHLIKDNPGKFSVIFERPYDYYTLTEDITQKLDDLMLNFESKYEDKINNESWILNLSNFYELVRNKGELDLKNQEEWQQSAFIYDGEVISGDAIANITYGYLGKIMQIPDYVLLAAAGYAQVSAGTSDMDFLLSFGDDPRDQLRIKQGIEIYNSIY